MKRGTVSQDSAIAAAAMEVPLIDGEPAKRVMLLPIGEIALRDGRGPYRIRDRAHAEQVVAATRSFLGTIDFNFDYGHGQENDQGAIASGWSRLDALSVEDDGIYADVEWTAAAAQRIRDKEYRYISPLFYADKPAKGGDVTRIKNAALVNIPALNMPAIAAGTSEDIDDMSLTAIAAACGLAASATEQDIVTKIGQIVAGSSAIAIAAGLAASAEPEAIAAAVTTMKTAKPDLSGYVPKSIVEPMQEELKKLKGERLGKQVDDLVAAGVVPPAKRKDTLDWFEKDEVAAAAFFKDMPALVQPGALIGDRKPTEKATSLSVDEVAACAAIGMSHADYLAAKNEEIA